MTAAKVAIVGGGPAGLTLARLLQQNQIEFTVYEGESDRYTRNQGGSLDLHPNGGQLAFAEAGLMEEFRQISRPEADFTKILAPSGAVLWDENVTGNVRPQHLSDRPEVDRTALRDLLLDSIEPRNIKWGYKIDRIDAQPDGRHTLHFSNNTSEPNIDLLVGADGAFSKVRPLVTAEQPHYSGITCIELWKEDVENTNPWLHAQIGPGSCFMFDEGRALLAQRQGGGSVRSYACVRQPLSWTKDCGTDWENPGAARKALVEGDFSDCGETVKRMILESSDKLVVRHLWMLPVGHTWESKSRVTLLGDAAHLMTPFAGVGVNTAMADSLDLARSIISDKEAFVSAVEGREERIKETIEKYESLMFVRAEKMTSKTYAGLLHHFSATGGQEWADRYRSFYEQLQVEKASGQ